MALAQSTVGRGLGITTTFKNLKSGGSELPQRVIIVGQGNEAATYSLTKKQFTNANNVAIDYGYGSPLHLAARQLLPSNGDGIGTIPLTIYPLAADGGGAQSAGDITPAGTATEAANYTVVVNNIVSQSFEILPADAVADMIDKMVIAINATLEMPVIPTDGTTVLDLLAKWKGTSGDDIVVSVVGPSVGVTFAITQLTAGAANPDVQDALDQIGDVWETMVVNCLEMGDDTNLNTYQTFGEGRWLPTVQKPLIVFTGENLVSQSAAIVITDARKTDRVNCQLVAPGSDDLPLVIAARQVARIAVVANNTPPHDYGSQAATGLIPGTDAEQWDSTERDTAVKAGSSTIQVKNGVINISDVVTFYHPVGEDPPAYRYVVDIIKLMQVYHNLKLKFDTPEWDGAPLVPDNQAITEPTAKQPKMAVGVVAGIIAALALKAVLSNPDDAIDSIVAIINSGNAKRLDISFTVQLSGNSNIIDVDLNFGFLFGTDQLIA